MIRTILFATGITLITAGSSIAADVDKSLHGTWKGRSVSSCSEIKNFTTDDYMVVHKNKIEFHEGTCLVRKSTKKGQVFTVSGFCENEGMTEQFTKRLQLDGKNHLIVDRKHRYDRCK